MDPNPTYSPTFSHHIWFSLLPGKFLRNTERATYCTNGMNPGQESLSDIAASACATNNDDNSIWKHEWACITNNQRRDEPALWVWVNDILLDSSNEALVLDCCIMPVDSMDHEASLQLDAVVGDMSKFIQVMDPCSTLSCRGMTVYESALSCPT